MHPYTGNESARDAPVRLTSCPCEACNAARLIDAGVKLVCDLYPRRPTRFELRSLGGRGLPNVRR